LIDGGAAADGSPFLVMEFVEGEPLVQHAQRAALSLEARVKLVVAICDAVDYAHRRLVVHRDLKPSNVLVTPQGDAKLLDFGIAKLLGERGDETATSADVRVMSPAYAAPEQILGAPVGTTTDVYSLGVMLYELLTGMLPHDRTGRSLDALARAIDTESVERPSAALRRGAPTLDTTRRARELDGDLDTIVMHALAREPDRRYPSAAAFAEDLTRYLGGQPIRARPHTWTYRAGKFVNRHRGGVTAALLMLVALLGSLALALWQADRARREATRATVQAERADREAQRAEGEAAASRDQAARVRRVKDFMMSIYLHEDPLRRTGADARPLTLSESFDLTLERISTELEADPALQADLYDDFGEIEAGRGDLAAATKLIERARELAERAHGPNHPAVAESLLNLGVLAGYRGDPLAGAPLLERAVAILEPYAETESTAYLAALGGLTSVRREQGRIQEAAALVEKELALRRRDAATDRRVLGIALHNAATLMLDLNRIDEAEAYATESLEVSEKANGPDNPNMLPLLAAMENIAFARGDLVRERALAERRLALARRHFPGDHRWVASALGESGYMLAREDPAAGVERIREAIAMYGRMGGAGSEHVSKRLATVLAQEGRIDEARASIDSAWDRCARQGNASQVCQLIRAERGDIMSRAGDSDAALAEIDAAHAALREYHQGKPADELAVVIAARASVLARLGRVPEAVEAQTEAARQYDAVYGKDHPATRGARTRLAELSETAPARSR
ncbi:MAG TPA: tetratricopeptide repeat protein, partial [Candidatus Saccharimonadia bacterium]|nr:tetratricopeptide repeat protein [Candidatus Saccharimonadia bacterium]